MTALYVAAALLIAYGLVLLALARRREVDRRLRELERRTWDLEEQSVWEEARRRRLEQRVADPPPAPTIGDYRGTSGIRP